MIGEIRRWCPRPWVTSRPASSQSQRAIVINSANRNEGKGFVQTDFILHFLETLTISKRWNCITTSDHHIEQLHYKITIQKANKSKRTLIRKEKKERKKKKSNVAQTSATQLWKYIATHVMCYISTSFLMVLPRMNTLIQWCSAQHSERCPACSLAPTQRATTYGKTKGHVMPVNFRSSGLSLGAARSHHSSAVHTR